MHSNTISTYVITSLNADWLMRKHHTQTICVKRISHVQQDDDDALVQKAVKVSHRKFNMLIQNSFNGRPGPKHEPTPRFQLIMYIIQSLLTNVYLSELNFQRISASRLNVNKLHSERCLNSQLSSDCDFETLKNSIISKFISISYWCVMLDSRLSRIARK
jgi:hypothetical protein